MENIQDEKTFVCEECHDTGYYGDNGPGIKGNREYVRCDCGKGSKGGMMPDLSEYSPEDRLKAAEFVCDRLHLAKYMTYEMDLPNPLRIHSSTVLTSADAALEAVAYAKLFADLQYRETIGNNTWAVFIGIYPKNASFVGVSTKDLPAAITLCLAMALGWRKESGANVQL